MASPKSIAETLAALRASVRERRRATTDAASLLAPLLAQCYTLAVEERRSGIAFKLEGENGSFRITCVLHHASRSPLTAAEAAVAELLCETRTLAQIAHLRGVSVNTIKSQVHQIFRKVNVDSRVALVRWLFP
jgi:DNA-binding CsgD family transcriptional regulator